jgi:hypothetical protein
MIVPTNGRVVLFTPSTTPDPGFVHHDRTKPLAATVVHVWNERLVNVVVFDSNGTPWGKTSVQLLQDDDLKPEYGYFCSWMEYQKGQAAKAEQAETALATAGGRQGGLFGLAGTKGN